jgi:hypothetical protein
MPDDNGTVETPEGVVDLDSYEKDKEEFGETLDAILASDPDKSDEEILKELDAKKDGTETDKAGEATGDQSDKTSDEGIMSEEDAKGMFTADDASVAQTDNDTGGDNTDESSEGTDWKAKYEELDAELKKERQKTSSWNGRITAANKKAEALQKEVDQLRAQVEAKAVDPDKESDQEVLERFREDFPELADVVNVLEKRITKSQPAPAQSSEGNTDYLEGDSGHSTVTDEGEVDTTHTDTIHAVHPDLAEMVNSGVLLSWIQRQKSFIKPALEDVYYRGNAQQVIDLCTQFKKQTGWKSQLDNTNAAQKAEKQSKLDAMKEVNSESAGAPQDGPDKNDFAGAAAEAFSEDK